MKLWLLTQDVNNDYDTYDSCVVAAETEDDARFIHPSKTDWNGKDERWSSWCPADCVKVELIGEAKAGTERGVILASFNAG